MDDALFQPVQVFQEPYAGTAVDGRNVEFDLADAVIGEFDEAFPDLGVVKVSVFLAYFAFPDLYPGMIGDFVVLTGVAPFQDLINSPATLATKRLFIENHRVGPATFPAMIARIFMHPSSSSSDGSDKIV
jgi:hypothetical protein